MGCIGTQKECERLTGHVPHSVWPNARARGTGAARAPQTDRYVGPGWGIDDLQKRYSRLNLVALRPHYDLVTLMDHMGSSLDRLEVDQRGRTFPPRAPRRLAATPNRTVSCLHTSIAPLPFVIGHF